MRVQYSMYGCVCVCVYIVIADVNKLFFPMPSSSHRRIHQWQQHQQHQRRWHQQMKQCSFFTLFLLVLRLLHYNFSKFRCNNAFFALFTYYTASECTTCAFFALLSLSDVFRAFLRRCFPFVQAVLLLLLLSVDDNDKSCEREGQQKTIVVVVVIYEQKNAVRKWNAHTHTSYNILSPFEFWLLFYANLRQRLLITLSSLYLSPSPLSLPLNNAQRVVSNFS